MPSMNVQFCHCEKTARASRSCRKESPVIANQCAHWCGNPYSFRQLTLCAHCNGCARLVPLGAVRSLICKKSAAGKRSHSRKREHGYASGRWRTRIFPRKDITRPTVAPPSELFGSVMSHHQENRFILSSPILLDSNSLPWQTEKGKKKPGSIALPGQAVDKVSTA